MKELSHNRFNRNDEREMDVFELEEMRGYDYRYDELSALSGLDIREEDLYGTYEDLAYENTYGVEKVYDYDDYQRDWN